MSSEEYSTVYYRKYPHPDELLERGEFTWAEWLEAFNWKIEEAVYYIEDNLYEQYDAVSMNQEPNGREVWDGILRYLPSEHVVMYEGLSGPGGQGEPRIKNVRGSDKFTVIRNSRDPLYVRDDD